MAPAKKKKPAAKTQANEATTTVQRSVYEDDRAQRVAANAQFLHRLELDVRRHDSATGEGSAEEVRVHATWRVSRLPRAYFDSMYVQEDSGPVSHH